MLQRQKDNGVPSEIYNSTMCFLFLNPSLSMKLEVYVTLEITLLSDKVSSQLNQDTAALTCSRESSNGQIFP